jgi:hypothetical protein
MTQDEVMQMMTDMGLHEGGMDNWVADNAWWKFAKLVAKHEREACAKVCEQTNDGTPYNLAEACAEAIRARGQA